MEKFTPFYLIIAALLLIFTPLTASSQWLQTNGPQGGKVTSMAGGNGYIFAGTSSAGIFRSSDEGDDWFPVNAGMSDRSVSSLVMRGSTLIAGSDNIFRSADYGANWVATSPGMGFVYYLAIDSDAMMASTDAGVVRSLDDGLTWTPADPWNDGTIGWPMTIDDGVTYILSDLGIYSSTDYGANWTVFDSTIFNFPLYTIFVRGGTYLVGDDDGGLWRRTDSAWTPIGAASGITGKTRCVAPDGTRLLAGTSRGVFASTDDGEHWMVLNTGLADTNINALLADGMTLYSGSNRSGVFRSSTGGSLWEPVTNGFNALRISSLAFTSPELFAGTRSGLFASSNAGTTWVFAGSGIPDDDITALLFSDSTLLAGTDGSGIFRSTDHAASWSSSNTGLGSLKVVELTRDDSLIYAATKTGQRMYSSSDDGESWTATNLHSYAVFPVNAIAAGNGYLYAGIFSGGSAGGMYRSSDRGTTWAQTSGGITDPYITSILCAGTLVFAGSVYGEVYRSTDAGVQWSLFNNGLPGDQIKTLLQSGQYFFAGTLGGVYRTFIDSSYWMAVNEGLADDIYSLAATESELFAGTGHSSVWKRPLGELEQVNVSIAHQPGWNMRSLPLFTCCGNALTTLYPSAITKAFAYQGSYVRSDSLFSGTGYWLKFADTAGTSFTGTPVLSLKVPLRSGWNLIGSISEKIAAGSLVTDPTGIIVSNVHGYDGASYSVADTITPGDAYWVKTSGAGMLTMSAGSSAVPLKTVRAILDDQPPPPPLEMEEGVTLAPEFSLGQNYPNPFNPVTTIEYRLAQTSPVLLKIYNVLGQCVATPVDEIQTSGPGSVRWDAANYPSGLYYYKLQAGNFSETRKLLLIK